MPHPPYSQRSLASLTPRERQVMPYIAEGRANKVIAIELGISQRTAEAHRARIFQKLGVRNAVELVRAMWQVPVPAWRLAEPAPASYGGTPGGDAVTVSATVSATDVAATSAATSVTPPPAAQRATGRRRPVRGPLHQWDPDRAGASGGKPG
jgi:DNA-binding CsgD family transcriptional regulator